MDAHLPHCTTCLKPLVAGWDCGKHEECHHYSDQRGPGWDGNIKCSQCGWIYRIGLTGSRWVEPGYEPAMLAEAVGGLSCQYK